MMGYIFVIDFGRYINVNINHYRHGQTLTNLTGANPIIAFFLGRREYWATTHEVSVDVIPVDPVSRSLRL